MTEEDFKFACSVGGLSAWSLNLDTNQLDFSGTELRGIDLNTPLYARMDSLHPDDAREMLDKIAAVSEEHPDYVEYRAVNVKEHGQYRWYLAKGALKPGTRMMYGVALDITERKDAEETNLSVIQTLTSTKENISNFISDLKQT